VPLTFSTEESQDGALVLKLAGSLDAMTAPELMPTMDRLVDEKRMKVTVNLEGLDLLDSSGVAAIVALYKRTRSNGGRVTVTGARDQPLAIFKLLRMDRVFAL
jgi:anti-sigma B factor antagonist